MNQSTTLYAFLWIVLIMFFATACSSTQPATSTIPRYQGMAQDVATNQYMIKQLQLDSDSDGICNLFDKEKNTPKGVAVDGIGVALDTDKDGIPDFRDDQPFSPPQAITNPNGSFVDSDKDGVADGIDLEPHTKLGEMVNFQGIAISPYLTPEEETPAPPTFILISEEGVYYVPPKK